MKALVTGGAGFIGSHLVDALAGKGVEVVVLDNLSSGSLNNMRHSQKDKVRLIKGDIRRDRDVRMAVKDVDEVFHLAACVGRSVTLPRLDFETNVLGTFNVLKACKESEVKRVVVASSVMVYGEPGGKRSAKESDPPCPLIPYGASKAASEAYSIAFYRTWGVPVSVLRYFNVYGPKADPRSPYSGVVSIFMGRVLRGLPPVVFGDGLQTRDFVYVEDVVKATVLAAERRSAVGEIINVGSGVGTSIGTLASMVLKTAGLEHLKPKRAPPRPHEYRHLHADLRKAGEILGFRPSVNLGQGLSMTWDHLRKAL